MKLRHIFTMLAAVLTMFVSCGEDQTLDSLSSISVDKSTVIFPTTGGTATITLNAGGDWKIGMTAIEKKVEVVKDSIPAWLSVTPTSGSAGEQTITVKTLDTNGDKSDILAITCNGQTQRIVVKTETKEAPLSTCKEVNDGIDGTTYKVGGTVTRISNTTYGNLYINDGTGEVYVYGTLDASGSEKNFSSLGIEVGDQIVVTGPRTTYNGTVELKNVSVVSITKSLIKVDSLSTDTIAKTGGELTAYLTVKGEGVDVDLTEAQQEWLSVKSVSTSGTTAKVIFKVAANATGDRSADLTFKTTSGGKEYTASSSFVQLGSIIETTIDKFNAAEVGSTIYRLTGVITKVANKSYGNVYIKDATGETYVYGIGSKGDFEKAGLKVGDIVTLTGTKNEYNHVGQLNKASLESHYSVTSVTATEFNAKSDSKTVYYMLEGTVGKYEGQKYDLTTYGNFGLTDATGQVYVYGLTTGYGGASKQFGKLGVKEGDKITIIGYKTSYNGNPQMGGAFFFSKAE